MAASKHQMTLAQRSAARSFNAASMESSALPRTLSGDMRERTSSKLRTFSARPAEAAMSQPPAKADANAPPAKNEYVKTAIAHAV